MDCPNPKRSGGAAAAVPPRSLHLGDPPPQPFLPEDAILEILARAPVRFIHRFKCVSRRWCDLISDPFHRKRFPQTLEGFFRIDTDGDCFHGKFISLPGTTAPLFDASISFLTKLPGNKNLRLLHSCNGLLLFGHYAAHWDRRILPDGKRGYILCNPTTEQWVTVPSAGCPNGSTYVVFDPLVSPHFHLFHLWENVDLGVIEVRTYSSETGVWINCTSKQRRWQEGGGWKLWLQARATFMGNTFVNGMLHFIVVRSYYGNYLIAGVGLEGKTCRVIRWPGIPGSSALFLDQSQGHLYCICGYQEGEGFYQSGISIWVLTDYDTEEWQLKCNMSFLKLFGTRKSRAYVDYNVVAIHPDCKWVFLVEHWNQKLIAYDMDNKKVHALCSLTHSRRLCTPFIPNYSELSVLANKH